MSHGLEQETCLFVPRHDPVKITRLSLTNRSDKPRRISVVCYVRLVLGVLPQDTRGCIISEFVEGANALLARNPQGRDFAEGVAFAALVTPASAGTLSYSADRASFLGRFGSPERPAALSRGENLDGKTGAGLDPCIALQLTFSIKPGETLQWGVLLGETTGAERALALVERYRQPGAIAAALDEVRQFWRDTLSAIRVETPSPAIDLMVNGWLLYQTLGCRLWGRSAFYQSGGAFGFRDQLQDSMALIYARPDLTRAQILLHAANQFVEGDVLHWWHPAPLEQGIRTRFSDDLLWLPYVTAFYLQVTGDWALLDEPVQFIRARLLEPGEDEAYLKPETSGESANLYEHCCRALDRSLTRGAHGLPLMGTGDWNDGMNRVGREGRGESVWVGFFLYAILGDFIPICERRGDSARRDRYSAFRNDLAVTLNDIGWDGGWYRRAYYDDGTPLGSAGNDECRIDALAQSWAVIAKAAPPARANHAMDAVEEHLISDRDGLIRLLTPPFDRTPKDPGYIKGYVAGIRENGGQYTHGVLWVVRAMAELERNNRAMALLEMLSPVNHARTAEEVARYQVEPYVVAADVYGSDPHVGRGGWTWYTGSAAWMYRVALESLLGFELLGGTTLKLKPCVPDTWPEYRLWYRFPDGKTRYEVLVRNPSGHAKTVVEASLDGGAIPVIDGAAHVPLNPDGLSRHVLVILGAG